MLINVCRSLVRALALWLIVVAAAFALFHVVPNDPARTILGANAPESQVEELRRDLGLDRSLIQQFGTYSASILRLDLGVSYVDRRRVAPEVFGRLPLTLALGAGALLLTCLYLVLVVVAHGIGLTRCVGVADFAMSSMPTLFAAVVAVIAVSAAYPFRHFGGTLASVESVLALLPASLVLALYPMATLSRMLRQQIREVSPAMFVTMARAKGLSEQQISIRHILPNAALPVVAALGNLIPAMLTAAFIVEIVFSLPGLGTLLIRSILQRDLPMIEGIVMINAAVTIASTFLIGLSVTLIDPRQRSHAS